MSEQTSTGVESFSEAQTYAPSPSVRRHNVDQVRCLPFQVLPKITHHLSKDCKILRSRAGASDTLSTVAEVAQGAVYRFRRADERIDLVDERSHLRSNGREHTKHGELVYHVT